MYKNIYISENKVCSIRMIFLLTIQKKRLNSVEFFAHIFLLLPSILHDPVLLESVLDIFRKSDTKKHIVVDATLGLGWHASEMCKTLGKNDIFIWLDRDKENLEKAEKYIKSVQENINPILIHSSFGNLKQELTIRNIDHIDFILYDLWVSSVHYDEGERGFSLRSDGPLDMRFDRSTGRTASEMIHMMDVRELSKIFTLYGEEKKSWFIAQAIGKAREIKKIETTFELIEIIENSSFDKKSPLRVFQAIRIALNEEFKHIEDSLSQAMELLSVGWKIAVITFHSVEDRLIKNIFTKYLEDTIDEITGQIRIKSHYKKYTKKPIIPTDTEVEKNPRSRSAKMRVIERIS